jgi:glycosyltransferase involved in cell wall biosynthesis
MGVQVSFIIPAHNEERLLDRTLTALHAAAEEVIGPGSYEAIVVDDASTDRTGEVAATFDHRGTRIVHVQKRQISAVRNAGAQAAIGDTFVFIDADTSINAPVLSAAMGAIRNGVSGGGAGIEFDGDLSWLIRKLGALMVLCFRVARVTGGCFLFCTRDAFLKVGGWDETLFATEEVVMCRALRRSGRFVILRERVLTSSRKIKTHSVGEILWLCVKAGVLGKKMLRKREGLDLWYVRREVGQPER